MTTEISKADTDLSVLYPDVLKRIWKEADRPDIYNRTKQFSYFWDNRDIVDQKK
jgi:hypothetical protein